MSTLTKMYPTRVTPHPFWQTVVGDHGTVEVKCNFDWNAWVAKYREKHKLSVQESHNILFTLENFFRGVTPYGKHFLNPVFVLPGGMKLDRVFLSAHPQYESAWQSIKQECSLAQTCTLVVSCRKNDILRRGLLTNTKTCIAPRGPNNFTLASDVLSPDIGVAFLKNKRGDLVSRVTLRIGYSDPETRKVCGLFVHTHVYGNTSVDFKSLPASAGIPIGGVPLMPTEHVYLDGDTSKFYQVQSQSL